MKYLNSILSSSLIAITISSAQASTLSTYNIDEDEKEATSPRQSMSILMRMLIAGQNARDKAVLPKEEIPSPIPYVPFIPHTVAMGEHDEVDTPLTIQPSASTTSTHSSSPFSQISSESSSSMSRLRLPVDAPDGVEASVVHELRKVFLMRLTQRLTPEKVTFYDEKGISKEAVFHSFYLGLDPEWAPYAIATQKYMNAGISKPSKTQIQQWVTVDNADRTGLVQAVHDGLSGSKHSHIKAGENAISWGVNARIALKISNWVDTERAKTNTSHVVYKYFSVNKGYRTRIFKIKETSKGREILARKEFGKTVDDVAKNSGVKTFTTAHQEKLNRMVEEYLASPLPKARRRR